MNELTINAFIDEFNEFQKTFQERAKEKFKEVFNEFWKENPGINVVAWTQYAPYHNDGDPCVFSVNDPAFSNATEVEDYSRLSWGEYEGEDENVWVDFVWGIRGENLEGVNLESVIALSKFIQSSAMESALESMFGSDNLVYATREGFTSETYEHEHD